MNLPDLKSFDFVYCWVLLGEVMALGRAGWFVLNVSTSVLQSSSGEQPKPALPRAITSSKKRLIHGHSSLVYPKVHNNIYLHHAKPQILHYIWFILSPDEFDEAVLCLAFHLCGPGHPGSSPSQLIYVNWVFSHFTQLRWYSLDYLAEGFLPHLKLRMPIIVFSFSASSPF